MNSEYEKDSDLSDVFHCQIEKMNKNVKMRISNTPSQRPISQDEGLYAGQIQVTDDEFGRNWIASVLTHSARFHAQEDEQMDLTGEFANRYFIRIT